MLQSITHNLAFVGDLHPVVVHFPVALLPTVLLLKLYQWRSAQAWIGSAVNVLLLLALAFAVVAIALGVTTLNVNGFDGAALDAHVGLALGTFTALLLTAFLHGWPRAAVRGWRAVRAMLSVLLRYLLRAVRAVWSVLKWILIVVLFPLVLLYIGLRALYRRLLRDRLQSLLHRLLAMPSLRGAHSATRQSPWAMAKARVAAMVGRVNTVPVWQNASYATALVLVLLTGLKGADVSHGEGHLTRNMPPAMAAVFGGGADRSANRQLDQAYFEQELLPALRRSCVKCHGEDKQKAGLRLDSYAAVIQSNAIRWQDPYGSELVKRILLPRDNSAAMPPLDKSRELHLDDIGRIVAWLQGHSLESVARQGGGLGEDLKRIARALPPIDDETLAALSAIDGMHVRRLVQNHDLLVVSLGFVAPAELDNAWQQLAPYALHIVDLDVSGRTLSTAHWQNIETLQNLRRLNLKDSNAGDADLARLTALRQLEWLNLFGTRVSANGAAVRQLVPTLKTVYLPATLAVAAQGS